MNELSLFTGSGGGVLGTTLLGWKHVGYVEYDNYCQKIIKQRIADGLLDPAPIFGDIRGFIRDGFAEAYKGMVDIVSAGFPCQPFSVAGKQQGENDPRNMWPETIECLRIIRPEYALLENVPGLLAHGYAKRIFGDLAESGFDVRWRVLSAAEVGAPHKRDRLWIVCHAKQGGLSGLDGRRSRAEPANGCKDVPDAEERRQPVLRGAQGTAGHADGVHEVVSDSVCRGCNRVQRQQRETPPERGRTCEGCEVLADAEGITERPGFCSDEQGGVWRGRSGDGSSTGDVPSADGGRCGQLNASEKPDDTGQPAGASSEKRRTTGWPVEPNVGRVAHGVASRVDRLKSIGNGQVPAVVRAVWEILSF